MRNKYLAISVATVAALLVVVVGANYSWASTVDVLTYGSVGGTNVAVNNVLTSSLSSGTSATFDTTAGGSSGGSCSTGTVSETVQTNPAVGGTADTSATSQSFSNCSDNQGYNLGSITMTTPYASTITSSGIGAATVVVVMAGSAGSPDPIAVRCTYTGTNVSGTTSFTNQHFTLTSSKGPCQSDMYFSASYNALVDTSVSGDPTVFVNS